MPTMVYAVMRGTELKGLYDTAEYADFIAAELDKTFPRGRRHSTVPMTVRKDPGLKGAVEQW